MKKLLCLLTTIALTAACVPKVSTPTPDRFKISAYTTDTSNIADITGAWIIVTKNASMTITNDDGAGHVQKSTQKIIGRRGCPITAFDHENYFFCGSIATLSGNMLISDGITYTINDNNTEMTAVINKTIIDDLTIPPATKTTILSGTYYLKKIAPANHVFGLMTTQNETNDVTEFTEELITNTSIMNGVTEPSFTEKRYYAGNIDSYSVEASITGLAAPYNIALTAHNSSHYFYDPHYESTATFTLKKSTHTQLSAICGGYDDDKAMSFTCALDLDI